MAEVLENPTVTVIVISRDSPLQAHFCLWCLRHALVLSLPFCQCQVVLMDNGSRRPYPEFEFKRSMPMELIRLDRAACWAGLVNLGSRRYPADFYFILDQNILLSEQVLSGSMGFCRMQADAGVVAPVLLNPNGAIYQAGLTLTRTGPVAAEKGRWPQHKQTLPKEVQAVGGRCMLLRNEVLSDLGGLDETAGLAEVDLCLRARQCGWRVFCLQQYCALCVAPPNEETLDRSWSAMQKFRSRWVNRYTLDQL